MAQSRQTDLLQEFTDLMDSIATKTSKQSSEMALAIAQEEWDRSIRSFVTNTNDNLQTLSNLLECSEEYRNKVKADLDAAAEMVSSLKYSIFEIQSAKNLRDLEVVAHELRKWEEVFAHFTMEINPAKESLDKLLHDLAKHMSDLEAIGRRLTSLEEHMKEQISLFGNSQVSAINNLEKALAQAAASMENDQSRLNTLLEEHIREWQDSRKGQNVWQRIILAVVVLNLLFLMSHL